MCRQQRKPTQTGGYANRFQKSHCISPDEGEKTCCLWLDRRILKSFQGLKVYFVLHSLATRSRYCLGGFCAGDFQ